MSAEHPGSPNRLKNDMANMEQYMLYLAPRERRCLLNIASRLFIGQCTYGELSPGKKDWKKEAKEEAMDMSVYLAALLEDDNENA